MNIIQAQNTLKDLSDTQLQKQLLTPDGSVPSFLVLSELQRRKDMRDSYAKQQANGTSMADEFSKGLGQANVGNYSEALKGAMPGAAPAQQPMGQPPMASPMVGGVPQGPMAEQPPVPEQGYAEGGGIFAQMAPRLDAMGNGEEPTASDMGLGVLGGLINGQSFGDAMGSHFKNVGNIALQGPAMRLIMGGKNLFADGGLVSGGGLPPAGSAGDMDEQNQFLTEADRSMMMGMPHNGGPTYAEGGMVNAFANPAGLKAKATPMETLIAGLAVGAGRPQSDLAPQLAKPGDGLPSATVAPAMAPPMPSPPMGVGPMGSADGATGADGVGGVGAGVGTGVGDAGVAGAANAAAAAANSDAGAAGMASGGVVRFDDGGDVYRKAQREWLNANSPYPVPVPRQYGPMYGPRVPNWYDRTRQYVRDNYGQAGGSSWYPAVQQGYQNAMNVPPQDLATMIPPGVAAVGESIMNSPDVQTIRDKVSRNAADIAQTFGVGQPGNIVSRAMGTGSYAPGPQWGLQDNPPDNGDVNFIPVGGNGMETGSEPPMPTETGGVPVAGAPSPYPVAKGLDVAQRPGTRGPGGVSPAGRAVAPAGGAAAGPAGAGAGGAAGGGSGLLFDPDSLAAHVRQVQGLGLPDRFGEMEARNREDRERLKAGVDSSKGEALLMAGLGIMGGDSPFAGVNIGRGAVLGMKQWNDAQKEMRAAEQAIRTAENQITIARANRDEKQLETGVKTWTTAQEAKQRAADRANAAGIAAAGRADALALKKMELASLDRDREERRDATQIKTYGDLAERYDRDATVAINAYRSLLASLGDTAKTASMTPQELADAKVALAESKTRMDALVSQAHTYRDLQERSANVVTARRQGIPTAGAKKGYDSEGNKFQPGQRFITKDGRFATWREE